MAIVVSGQGAEKAGRKGGSPFSCCLEHGSYGYMEFAGIQTHTRECTFSLPDPLKGSMDPFRMNFGAVLGSLLKQAFAVVQTVYPRRGSRRGSCRQDFCCDYYRPCASFPMMKCCLSFSLSPDHCVHYYDLRNTKQPIMVFKGHRKAVSYAKFVSGEEIVSA